MQLAESIQQSKILLLDYTTHIGALETLIAKAIPESSTDLQFHALEEIRAKSEAKEINMGKGFALSHARIEGIQILQTSVALFGEKTNYLPGDPVHTVFCTMIPPSESRVYLKFMSTLTRFLLQDNIELAFLQRDINAIVQALKEFDAFQA